MRGKEQLCNSFNWSTTDYDLTLSAASAATTILDFLLISSDLIVNKHLFTVAVSALLSCHLQWPTSLFLDQMFWTAFHIFIILLFGNRDKRTKKQQRLLMNTRANRGSLLVCLNYKGDESNSFSFCLCYWSCSDFSISSSYRGYT